MVRDATNSPPRANAGANAEALNGGEPGRQVRMRSVARTLVIAAFFIHLTFLLLFVGLGVWILALVNVASVGLYAFCARLITHWDRLQTVMSLAGVEIILHAGIASPVLGWESGFHYYVLALAPLIFLDARTQVRAKITIMGVLIVLYLGISVWTHEIDPLRPLDAPVVLALHYVNMILSLVLMAMILDAHSHSIQRAERRLQSLAETDNLTGLPNRHGLLRFAEQFEALPTEQHSEAAAVIIDVDHFKAINDQHGHGFGDTVLRTIASTMQMQTREQDILARWGGEEFLLLLYNADLMLAFNVAERIRDAISQQSFEVQDRTLQVTITTGIALWQHGESFEMCVDRADEALYHGKRSGRNQSVVYREALSQPL
ncbi:GGDEF domain-containing protein [Salicola sp. Rm-C-2C1-2]|uniref:GGDEF domain-containing protein n=1 Tax=Salicola sp. Rm-C-2C1-2 TaxID=3141321 RepID=UPI0032E5191A